MRTESVTSARHSEKPKTTTMQSSNLPPGSELLRFAHKGGAHRAHASAAGGSSCAAVRGLHAALCRAVVVRRRVACRVVTSIGAGAGVRIARRVAGRTGAIDAAAGRGAAGAAVRVYLILGVGVRSGRVRRCRPGACSGAAGRSSSSGAARRSSSSGAARSTAACCSGRSTSAATRATGSAASTSAAATPTALRQGDRGGACQQHYRSQHSSKLSRH
jgi:hypothetical protein